MIRQRSLFRVALLTWSIGTLLASALIPSLAVEYGSGWTTGPEVRRHTLESKEDQFIPGWTAAPDPDPHIKVFEPRGPRAFGLLTGDKVRHQLLVIVEEPYKLQRSSLPPSRWIDTWLELQQVEVEEARQDEFNRYLIELDYQIFSTPRAVTLDFIPGFELRFASRHESFSLTVPDWIFSISPMLKPEPEVETIAEIPVRADAPPPLVDASLPKYGLALFGGLSLAFSAYWMYFNQIWPFRRRGQAPFARAYRRLRTMQGRADNEQGLRDGFRVVHQAFNQTAGEVVFAERLERFFDAQPAFASRRAAIEDFFGESRQLFFGGNAAPTARSVDLLWLQSLCRQCRAAEREAR